MLRNEQVTVKLEMKSLTETGDIEGYGAIFNNIDDGGDIIHKGAFLDSLATSDTIKMLWQHRPSEPIGVWTDAQEDSRGLFLKGRILLAVPEGKKVYSLLQAKAVNGLSIGYRTIKEDYEEIDGKTIRNIRKVDVKETSIVTFPANIEATVTDVKRLSSIREVEHILRDANVPGEFAKLVALYGFDEAKSRVNDHREGDTEAKEQATRVALMEKLGNMKGFFNAR